MTKKKPEPNSIEEAIGARANPQTPLLQPDEPTQNEMVDLENLNHQAMDRLQEQWQEPVKPTIPVSKPDPQPVTKTSSQESPPQKNELDALVKENFPVEVDLLNEGSVENLNLKPLPAEAIELTNLKKYILDDGFVLATVAFHIMSLCAEPLTSPSTTRWDYVDRAKVPDMVLALLNQPGYLEGIWPSLAVVMGSNKGNSAWTAGIATTIAFFDTIRVIPALKELQNETV